MYESIYFLTQAVSLSIIVSGKWLRKSILNFAMRVKKGLYTS